MPKGRPRGRSKRGKPSRAEELLDFLQGVALGKCKASEREIGDAIKELRAHVPDAENPEDEGARSH
jgi:hypothetical protein